MSVEAFNDLAPDAAASVLEPCAAIESWVAGVLSGRPYDTPEGLYARADRLAREWTPSEVLGALGQHPRIGERHSGPAAEADHSAREQSAVGSAGDAADRLAAGNRAYEERFGRVFLIRAAGRSTEQILTNLDDRLRNDDEAELLRTADELRQIALLRLGTVVS